MYQVFLSSIKFFRRKHEKDLRKYQEDFLKALYHYGTKDSKLGQNEEVRKQARIPKRILPKVIGSLVLEGLIETSPLALSEKGYQVVLSLIRRHRIYEKYLAEHSGYTADEWHDMADKMEHCLKPNEQKRLLQLLRNPLWDPHGDPIPTEGRHLLPEAKSKDTHLVPGKWYKIKHIEDDYTLHYRAINQTGLAQGSLIKIVDLNKDKVCFNLEGDNCTLSLKSFDNIDLEILEVNNPELNQVEDIRRLTSLRPGEIAQIIGISPACLGAMRRRLMDLGFVRGSSISIDMKSPMGTPTAYLIRHTIIALRDDQARHILIVKRSS